MQIFLNSSLCAALSCERWLVMHNTHIRVVFSKDLTDKPLRCFLSLSHHQGGQTHLLKALPGPNYLVITHQLSFSWHLGVSQVAQAPDLPWGTLATVSP